MAKEQEDPDWTVEGNEAWNLLVQALWEFQAEKDNTRDNSEIACLEGTGTEQVETISGWPSLGASGKIIPYETNS